MVDKNEKVTDFFLFITILVKCTDNSVEPIDYSEADRIRETVLRYRIENLSMFIAGADYSSYMIAQAEEDTLDPSVPYLQPINYQNFDGSFLQLFSDITPPVKNYSCCEFRDLAVYDIETNERALLFYVGKIVYEEENKVKLFGGHYSTGAGAAAEFHYLTISMDSITIDSTTLNWVSDMGI